MKSLFVVKRRLTDGYCIHVPPVSLQVSGVIFPLFCGNANIAAVANAVVELPCPLLELDIRRLDHIAPALDLFLKILCRPLDGTAKDLR
jgi:hypothetical protein